MTLEIAIELSDDISGFISEEQIRHYYILGEDHYNHAMDKQWDVIRWLHGSLLIMSKETEK